VVVNIANEDKKLQTPADIIPLYAKKIKYPFFTLKLDFDVATVIGNDKIIFIQKI
jgi:hypothetical protein